MAHKNFIACDKATLSKDISGKTYIVTGANSGVGFTTTKQLVTQGWHVIMACRNTVSGEKIAKQLDESKGSYEVMHLDLADLASVRTFVESFLAKHKRLDGLMCNAWMVNMENTPKYSKDGFEITWAASYYGHFLLTELLLDTLKNTPESRMGIVSSVVHAGSPKNRHTIHLDDLNYTKRKYNNFAAYGEAKLAAVLYALELADRLKDTGISTASIHPGWARSNFGSGGNIVIRTLMKVIQPFVRHMTDSNEESAQTSLHVLLSDDARNHSGAYFSQHSVLYREGDKLAKKGGWPMESPNPHAHDLKMAKMLVARTRELVGLN